ncbi:MAG: type II toxin-antitoxin system VapC family toxin [Hyphomicrobium sp.]
MRFVVDTSVVVKFFLAEPHREKVEKLIGLSIRGDANLLAPSLLLYEVNSVLVGKRVTGQDYDRAISVLMGWIRNEAISITEFSEELLRRAEAIASLDTRGQGHISSFDATFHALALMNGATFLTSDETYVRKARALVGSVELLQDLTI